MFIKEIELHNFYGTENILLTFQCGSPVYVVTAALECPLKNAISTAIQLLCSAKYATVQSLETLSGIKKGFVRIVFMILRDTGAGDAPNHDFLSSIYKDFEQDDTTDEDDDQPCTSRHALAREAKRKERRLQRQQNRIFNDSFHKVEVVRDLTKHPHLVAYRFNDSEEQLCTLPIFHARFQLNVDYILPRLSTLALQQKFGKINWLDCLNTNSGQDCNGNLDAVFERFISLFTTSTDINEEHHLGELTKCYHVTNLCLTAAQKRQILETFCDVRSVFEYLSDNEYTVLFIIPYKGEFVDIKSVCMSDLDFSNMHTRIELCSQVSPQFNLSAKCDTAGPMQDLLLVAFQLVLAHSCKQRLVYINNLMELKRHECLEIITISYMQIDTPDIKFPAKNYVQRIANCAQNIGLVAIIEYPGALLVPVKNVNLISTVRTQSRRWNMIVDQEDSSGLEDFIAALKRRLYQH